MVPDLAVVRICLEKNRAVVLVRTPRFMNAGSQGSIIGGKFSFSASAFFTLEFIFLKIATN